MKKTLFALVICSISAAASYSQIAEQSNVLRARHLSIRDGLSSNLLYCLFQDSKGFIWIGTGAGLDKYDGHTFRKYLQHTEDSIGNAIEWQSYNWTTSITEDNSGTIWATRGLLVSIDRKTGKETWYRHDKNNSGSIGDKFAGTAFVDSKGRLWVGLETGQLDLFEPKTKTFRHFDYLTRRTGSLRETEGIKQISERDDGRLILSSGGFSAVTIFDPNDGSFTDPIFDRIDAGSGFFSEVAIDRLNRKSISVYSDTINKSIVLFQGTPFHLSSQKITIPRDRFSLLNLHADKTLLYRGEEKYWFTSESSGLLELDYKNGNISVVSVLDEQKSPVSILDVFRSRDGKIWMRSTKGLYVANDRDNAFYTIMLHTIGKDQLTIPIRTLFIDKAQTLWAGTGQGTIFRYDSAHAQFREAITFPSHSLYPRPSKINGIVQDKNSRLWITVRGGSLYSIDSPFTRAIRRAEKPLSIPEETNRSSWNAMVDTDGIVWTGYMQFGRKTPEGFGLMRVDPNSLRVDRFSYLPDSSILGLVSVYERDRNTLWVGAGVGLCIFDKRTERFSKIYSHDPKDNHSISKGAVWLLFRDHRNRLWIPTESGLDLLNEKEGVFTHFAIGNGQPQNAISAIVEDRLGKLWLATENGIVCFDPETSTSITYTSEDGLPDDPLRFTTAVTSQAGEFFFGGADGVTCFFPAQIQKSVVTTPLLLTNFKVSDSVWYDELANSDTISLTYKENYFSVDISFLTFGNTSQQQYEYMLEGYDKQWIKAGDRRTISYNNVPPGNYRMKVRASTRGEKVFQNEVSAFIYITPPFWDRWWFRSFGLLLLISLLFYFFNARRNKQLLLQNRLDDARESERVNLAGELHDGPLQDLYGARFLLEPLLAKDEHDASAIKLDEVLAKVRRDLRAMTGELQIPHFDSGFAEELRVFCTSFAERHPTIEVIEHIAEEAKPLPLVIQQNLFRLFRTAMANVAKHANASRVEILFATREGTITLKIIDNGTGFMVPNDLGSLVQNKHYGLFLMHSYAQTIKAKYSVHSRPGFGTEVGVFI
ncbi:MAG: two-component regulator propeller domain-containing protein [Bacteroidota bacterium]|nr:two-component regulator propeller domain-containing protein [Bacteroidota bacterium]